MPSENVEVSMKLSPKKTGRLYIEWNKATKEINSISKAIHYPECWDTFAYPTLLDAVKEIGCNPQNCLQD